MADDLRESLLEEIALEGLDGITINALFLRLEERRGFPLRVNDQSKQFIWNCVLDLQDIEFYQLEKPRPELVSFNRSHYIDPDTRHFLETSNMPDDIYPVQIIEEEGLYGSCCDFKTRKNITQQVKDVKQPLKATAEKYGSTLVIVADQDVRIRTIIGPDNDPILNLSNPSYCVLERIARSRYSGETSSGKRSLQLLGQSSKSLFYQIKKFRHLGIVKRQRVCAIKRPTNVKVSHFLYHLRRFYSRALNRQQMELQSIMEFLSEQPENMCEVAKMKASVKVYDKNFKKISQLCIGPDRIFEFIDVPYREVYPDSLPKDYMTKQGKTERTIRHIKALKTMTDLKKSWEQAESSEDEEEEEEEEERAEPLQDESATPFHRAYDLPYMFQVMEVFRNAGAKGLSQVDLVKIMKCNRLTVRRYVNFLIRSNYLRTVTMDRGRQKILVFVAIENVQDNTICQNMMKQIVKYGPTLTGELDRMGTGHGKTKRQDDKKDKKQNTGPSTSGVKVTADAEGKIIVEPTPSEGEVTTGQPQSAGEVINEPQSGGEIITITDASDLGDKISSIHEELVRVDEGFSPNKAGIKHKAKAKKEVLRQIISEDETRIAVTVEELHQPKPGSTVLGLKRFGSMLSESHIRRINWIIEVVSAIKMIESFRMLKLLRNREREIQISTKMDNSSLKRLVVALAEDKKIRCFLVKMKMGENTKDMTFLCSSEVDEKSATFIRHLDEAKLRYFSISREELRKYPLSKKDTTSSIRQNTVAGVPETAQESIKEYREYRKKLEMGHPKMKFNRRAGLKYGLLPKMLRIQAAHQYLFHLCYDTYGNDIVPAGAKAGDADKQLTSEEDVTTMNAADKVIQPVIKVEDEGWPSQDPPIYFDEWTWRRHLSPVPIHSGYPKGWCLLSDVLVRLPVYLFCQIVNVCYDIEGLPEILQNTKRKFYPLINLPLTISQQLLHSKKYIHSFLELCNYLCEMGLLTFGKDGTREQTFVYIHQNASMMDTRESLKGYNKTTAPENVVFPTKSFRFEKLSDLHGFWESLQIIALTSNLSYKSKCRTDLLDERTLMLRSLKDVTEPCSVEDIIDDQILPGDRRGAAGMDSSLFVHCLKNWTFRSMSKSAIGDKPNPRHYLSRGLQTGLEIIGKRKTVDNNSKGLKLKGQERLHLSENPDKPVEIKKVKKENVKINRGGKGVKRSLPSNRVFTRYDRRPKDLKHFVPKLTKKKKAFEKGDDKDRVIYSTRTKQRVVWTEREDSMLLMCRLATLIMDNSRKVSVVSYMTMRDFLHENCGEMSKDKSSQACNRRLKFVLKNKNTESNLLLYYREAIQDEHIVKNYMSKQYINTDATVIPTFKSLTHYLIQKFQELNVQKCTLPASLKELQECNIEPIERLAATSHKQYKDVTCKEDICKDVLRNILHSAVLLQDKQSRTHEMFKLLTQYPDLILSDVIKELRADGLFVIQKKNYQREAMTQLHAGLGLRNFKVSQRYMYNYKHRYLSTLFEESAELLDKLCQSQQQGQDQGITLDFHPKGGQSAILIPLVLQKVINLKITMPTDLVVIDMEGFYNFPWGRGKLGTQKADKTIQGLQDKTHATPGLSGMSKESATGTKNPSFVDENVEESVVAVKESVNSVKETGAIAEISGPGEASSSQADAKVAQNSEKMDTEEGGRSNNLSCNQEEPDKSSHENMDYKLLKSNKETNKDGEMMQTEDTSGLSKRKTDDIKDDDDANRDDRSSSKEKSDKTDKPVEYSILKNGSSTILMPKNEPRLPYFESILELNHYHGIASRTLISLRRSEGPLQCSVEDIRLFNAQDNFVVKSCEIEINIRESGLGSDKGMNEVKKDGTKSEEVTEEKHIDRLMPPKLKMKELWNELQRLLPFKLDVNEMWTSMGINHGISKEDLKFYKYVYQLINSHGELGIKMFDLKRHFSDSVQWKDAIKMLAHYAAVVEVGVTDVRYVTLEHARPWVIHAYRNIKGRGLHMEEELESETRPLSSPSREAIVESVEITGLYSNTQPQENSDIKAAEENRKRKFDAIDEASDVHDLPIADGAKKPKLGTQSDEGTASKMNENETKQSSEHGDGTGDEMAWSTQEHGGTVVSVSDRIVINDENAAAADTDDKNAHEEVKDIRTRGLRKRKSIEPTPQATNRDPPPTSTYDKVRLIIQPWRKPEGGINKPVLKMMLESVMLFLMMKPGSGKRVLLERYSPYLQPMVLQNIVHILEELGCIKTQYITEKKCSLFSKPTLPDISSDVTEDAEPMYLPTEECVFRLGQFGREFFPHAKWPPMRS